jgi:hypothetical protein
MGLRKGAESNLEFTIEAPHVGDLFGRDEEVGFDSDGFPMAGDKFCDNRLG